MIELVLKRPLEFGKIKLDKLSFRESATAGDILAFDTKGAVAQNIELIASLSGNEKSVIMQLDRVDYNAAVAIIDKIFADDDTEKKS
jgi:hypothetical protein